MKKKKSLEVVAPVEETPAVKSPESSSCPVVQILFGDRMFQLSENDLRSFSLPSNHPIDGVGVCVQYSRTKNYYANDLAFYPLDTERIDLSEVLSLAESKRKGHYDESWNRIRLYLVNLTHYKKDHKYRYFLDIMSDGSFVKVGKW